jgi:hypothetical protein
MRRLALALLLVSSCTPSIERMERDDHTALTDSALSLLSSIEGRDTVSIVSTRTVEKTNTVEKIRYVEVESAPVLAMVRPVPLEGRRCDTVYIRDTVWISR